MAEGDSFGPDRYWDTGVHVPRYLESIEWLRPWLKYQVEKLPPCLLEVGGCGVWTRMLNEALPWVKVAGTEGDLRWGWTGNPTYDAVAFMEVMEHLWDVPIPEPGRWPDEFTGSAVKNVLRSIYSSLKPGGVMLLTTPNAASYNAIWKAMGGGPGITYRPHFREYSCGEVQELVSAAGFRILRHETLEVWGRWGEHYGRNGQMVGTEVARELVRNMVASLNFTTEMRGEDQFLLAQKPVDA